MSYTDAENFYNDTGIGKDNHHIGVDVKYILIDQFTNVSVNALKNENFQELMSKIEDVYLKNSYFISKQDGINLIGGISSFLHDRDNKYDEFLVDMIYKVLNDKLDRGSDNVYEHFGILNNLHLVWPTIDDGALNDKSLENEYGEYFIGLVNKIHDGVSETRDYEIKAQDYSDIYSTLNNIFGKLSEFNLSEILYVPEFMNEIDSIVAGDVSEIKSKLRLMSDFVMLDKMKSIKSSDFLDEFTKYGDLRLHFNEFNK